MSRIGRLGKVRFVARPFSSIVATACATIVWMDCSNVRPTLVVPRKPTVCCPGGDSRWRTGHDRKTGDRYINL